MVVATVEQVNPPIDPFDRRWVSAALGALVQRAESGERLSELREELFVSLWPWALRYADRVARRLPSGADADETRSRILAAMWEATQRFEPSLAGGWPSLLKQRLVGARIDAARHDDRLSRRDRAALSAANEAIAVAEQHHGRHLRSTERDAIIRRCLATRGATPFASRVGDLSRAAHQSPAHCDGQTGSVPEMGDSRQDPERLAMDGEVREALSHWLADDLPVELSRRVVAWWQSEATRDVVPDSLARQLRPYLHRLVPLFDPQA